MAGIKETKEVIVALGILKDILVKHLGDGFQPTDLPKLSEEFLKSPEFMVALDGVVIMLPELKDLDTAEKISLALEVIKAIA